MRPIRRGDGTGLSVPGFSEVRKGDGTVLWSAGGDIPDSENLYARYDASQLNGFNDQDTVNTWTPETGPGDAIASGSPTYLAGEVNGKAAVGFDGSSDFFDLGYVVTTDNSRSRYVVWQANSQQDNPYGVYNTNAIPAVRTFISYDTEFGRSTTGWGETFVGGDDGTNGQTVITASVSDNSTTTHTTWENQTQLASGSYSPSGSAVFNEFLGARNRSGSPESYVDGYLCEYLDYDVAHDQAIRNDIELYLSDKWGVTL